jgi:ABC-type uncharacterized transport system ATPase subunit
MGTTAIIEFDKVSKSYGAVHALQEVSFKVEPGSIHAVIGENGAGKSTAMKILYGMTGATQGEVWLRGQRIAYQSPLEALEAGVGMVHQHFMLSGPESVLENIVLGAEHSTTSWGRGLSPILPWSTRASRLKLEKVMADTGLVVPLDARLEDLPVGLQQRVEILKALYRNAEILILDEPTAVLLPQEVDRFFEQIQRLRDRGTTILVVTHKLREVKTFTDRVTVLRGGRGVLNAETKDQSYEDLGEAIVGRPGVYQKVHTAVGAGKAQEVRVRTPGLIGFERFEVCAGEIVGVAGVEGSGQRELLRAICEPRSLPKSHVGSKGIEVLGEETEGLGTSEIRSMSVSHIPGDRHEESCVLDRSLKWNLMLGRTDEFFGRGQVFGGTLNDGHLEAAARQTVETWDVKPEDIELPFRALSGGNQQKFVVGRELGNKPKVVVAVHPTRGVDLGAVDRIHRGLVEARDRGAAIVLVSSELDELIKLSDRLVVLSGGKMIREFRRGEVDDRALGVAMGGGQG